MMSVLKSLLRGDGLHRLRRYMVAFIGPAGSAGAQFLTSLILLRLLLPDMFGHFSFLMILSQFMLGVWSALFGAALPVIMGDEDVVLRDARREGMFAANLVATLFLLPLFVAINSALGLPIVAGSLFALFSALSMMRGFARAHAYSEGRAVRVMLSDLAYSLILIAGLPLLLLNPSSALAGAGALFAIAVLGGLLVFGTAFHRQQFIWPSASVLRRYGEIWKMHSGWSLLGVLTTEATINAHAYIVTLVSGPGAFAVLAASSLLTRPISVIMSALGEYERAHMASEIASSDAWGLCRSLRFFRLVMLASWLGTAALLAGILTFVPRLVFPPIYPVSSVATGSILWMAVMLVRAVRAPESAMLQGAGEFRPLAYASVYSALISVAAVFLLLWLAGPLWSISGILAGEAVFGLCLWPVAWKWRRTHMPIIRPIQEKPA